jgi:hypothetical protein
MKLYRFENAAGIGPYQSKGEHWRAYGEEGWSLYQDFINKLGDHTCCPWHPSVWKEFPNIESRLYRENWLSALTEDQLFEWFDNDELIVLLSYFGDLEKNLFVE